MSRANLQVAPDPADAVISGLRERLESLFVGIKIKNLAYKHNWIEVALFGQAEALVRHGLVTNEMLGAIPKSNTKCFRSAPGLGGTGYVHVRRGKSGVGFSTIWDVPDEEEVIRDTPLWIQSALRQLREVGTRVREEAARRQERSEKQIPEVWRADRLGRVTAFADYFLPQLWDTESLVEGSVVNSQDLEALKAECVRFTTSLSSLIRQLRFSERRHLQVVR